MKREANLFKRIVGTTLASVLVMGLVPAALAQDKEERKKQKEPTAKQKAELKSVYKKWLEEDVLYIITTTSRPSAASWASGRRRSSTTSWR